MIGRCLDEIDWEYELQSLDANSQYCIFLDFLIPLIHRYVPLADIDNKASVPWTINPPRELLRRKSEAWYNYKSLRLVLGRANPATMNAWEDFISVNSEIKTFAVNSQRNYECLLGDQLKSSPRLFHSYIKRRKVNRPSIGPLKLPNGEMTDNPSIMADYLVNSFVSVFNLGDYISVYQNQMCENDISRLVEEIW